MSEKKAVLISAVVAYLVGAILAFGHAGAGVYERCEATLVAQDRAHETDICGIWGALMGVPAGAAWPLYLSVQFFKENGHE